MCGRYYLNTNLEDILSRYNIKEDEIKFSSKEEIFPSEECPIVLKDNKNKLKMFKWGFKPHYGKGLIINARSETVDKKPTFRESFYKRRCIIPAKGFFEWEKKGKDKIKHTIYLENEDIFSLAGIYDTFQDEEGRVFYAFTILTTVPNNEMMKIHNRMPVIIKREHEDFWLDNNENNIGRLKLLFKPYKEKMIIE